MLEETRTKLIAALHDFIVETTRNHDDDEFVTENRVRDMISDALDDITIDVEATVNH